MKQFKLPKYEGFIKYYKDNINPIYDKNPELKRYEGYNSGKFTNYHSIELDKINIDIYQVGTGFHFVKTIYIHIKNIDDNRKIRFLRAGSSIGEKNIISDVMVIEGMTLEIQITHALQTIYIGSFKSIDVIEYEGVFTSSYNFDQINNFAINSDIDLIVIENGKTVNLPFYSSFLYSSKYFANLFQSGEYTKRKVITTQFSKCAMLPILQYLFMGKLNRSIFNRDNYSTILEIYSIVIKFELDKIKHIIELYIICYLNELNFDLLAQCEVLSHNNEFVQVLLSYYPYLTKLNTCIKE
ncbi:hypothetical protein CONCODRAFT_7808 [Conidiobolus coronatus NRRL 28638]|uniref:BTB domain-containing protein n=1 Tax=Conidiobolus coronatus (strain ATCC 28846 / CBS 209.66 / NRRL 28638) TaxID=796925 RepID=A0A137P3Z3_CONC2|nr:hypothetical protein CONCODRAFT_7808 [Conidiobolus coronatus NRRL 28638]|eukprot:KXN69723.1 hypothetical protein CONCODRAFT_7808 [Conidiobolus coronatus NRRL 28638]